MGFARTKRKSPSLGLLAQCPKTGDEVQEDQRAPSSVVQWELQSMDRQETWALVQGLLLSDTLRRESYYLPRPQSHSLRNEVTGLNYVRAHCYHVPGFMSASAQHQQQLTLTGASQAGFRGLLGPGEVGDTGVGPRAVN